MRKDLLFSLVIAFVYTFFAFHAASTVEPVTEPPVWTQNYAEAEKLAIEKNRVLLMYFSGSDWCYWCGKLHEEVFSQKVFGDFARENFVLFLADFPKQLQLPPEIKLQNKNLAAKHNVKGVPVIILVDKEGKTLGRTGYREGGAELFIEHLKGLLQNRSSPLPVEQE